MPKIVRVKDIKAADPGFGFNLEISENSLPTNQTLKVTVSIVDETTCTVTHTSSVTVNDNLKSISQDFVVPFADPDYASSSEASYSIAVECPIGTLVETITGVVDKEAGHFVSVPMLNEIPACSSPVTEPNKVLWVGQVISSYGNASNFGLLLPNGSFMVMPTSFVSLGSATPTIVRTPTPSASTNANPIGIYVDANGRIYISYIGTTVTPICQSTTAIAGASMVISDGNICLKNGSTITPVSFSLLSAGDDAASSVSFYEPAEKLEESIQS